MESATRSEKESAGLFKSNQVTAFDYAERRAAIAARIAACVGRAFQAIGASSATQEIIFWNLSVTKNMGRNEIADKPREFIEGMQSIYGEAGTAVFEYLLGREIRREFNLTFPMLEQERKGAEKASEVLQLISYVTLER